MEIINKLRAVFELLPFIKTLVAQKTKDIMNFRIPAAFLVTSVLVFSACCSSHTSTGGGGKLKDEKQQQNVQTTQASDTLHKQASGSPTAIKEHSSVITGEIMDKKIQDENDFELMVMVKASDDTDYESLIVKGMVYQMKPAFTEENGKIQPVEKNKKLMELKSLPKGSTFRARVSLTEGNRCIIQEVLDK